MRPSTWPFKGTVAVFFLVLQTKQHNTTLARLHTLNVRFHATLQQNERRGRVRLNAIASRLQLKRPATKVPRPFTGISNKGRNKALAVVVVAAVAPVGVELYTVR